jgi:hypothetical protein
MILARFWRRSRLIAIPVILMEMKRRAIPRMIKIVLRSITTKVVHVAMFYRWFRIIKPHAAWRRPPHIACDCALSAH